MTSTNSNSVNQIGSRAPKPRYGERITSTVYLIKCLANGRKYYGSCALSYFPRRRGNHWSQLRRGVHKNKALQADYNKYGKDQFEFLIVAQSDIINPLSLVVLEMSLIASDEGCYNSYKKASPVSAECRAKIGQGNSRIPQFVKDKVLELSAQGMPAKEIAKETNLSVSAVYGIIGAANN